MWLRELDSVLCCCVFGDDVILSKEATGADDPGGICNLGNRVYCRDIWARQRKVRSNEGWLGRHIQKAREWARGLMVWKWSTKQEDWIKEKSENSRGHKRKEEKKVSFCIRPLVRSWWRGGGFIPLPSWLISADAFLSLAFLLVFFYTPHTLARAPWGAVRGMEYRAQSE